MVSDMWRVAGPGPFSVPLIVIILTCYGSLAWRATPFGGQLFCVS